MRTRYHLHRYHPTLVIFFTLLDLCSFSHPEAVQMCRSNESWKGSVQPFEGIFQHGTRYLLYKRWRIILQRFDGLEQGVHYHGPWRAGQGRGGFSSPSDGRFLETRSNLALTKVFLRPTALSLNLLLSCYLCSLFMSIP
jgi:hypothetical protein